MTLLGVAFARHAAAKGSWRWCGHEYIAYRGGYAQFDSVSFWPGADGPITSGREATADVPADGNQRIWY